MSQKSKKQNSAVIIAFFILIVTSFLAGRIFNKGKIEGVDQSAKEETVLEFSANKNNKPEFKFYVMSFCPFGNQIESVIKPVYDLLKNSVDWKPQYIFSQVQDPNAFCQEKIYDQERCETYLDQGYFQSLEECKSNFVADSEECKGKFLLETNGATYSSLHGRGELNQNIREICAYDQKEDKSDWWNFIDLVNQNCNQDNADSCWEQQARESNLDIEKIKSCFNQNATDLVAQHLKDSQENNAFSSPTLFINGQSFPPSEAYQQDGQGQLQINGQVYAQEQYRSPEVLKQAICVSFEKAPPECKTKLEDKAAVTQGGC